MIFNEQEHKYTHNGDEYISATQLIKKFGLSVDYSNIPADVLAKAATKGKAIHKGLELYINGDKSMVGLLTEVDLFDSYINQINFDVSKAQAETIVYDTNYKIAGTIDFMYEEDGAKVIADFKTTSTLHIDTVAWQLSIYNYIISKGDLLKYYFNKLKVYWFNGGRLSIKDIYNVEFEAVEALFEAHKNDLPFLYVKPTKVITPSQEVLVGQILREIKVCEEQQEKLKKELQLHLNEFKKNFILHKEYSFKNEDFIISYLSAGTKKSLDHTKVKEYLEGQGENVDDFYNVTNTPDQIKIRLNKIE